MASGEVLKPLPTIPLDKEQLVPLADRKTILRMVLPGITKTPKNGGGLIRYMNP
jgi:hypothetical protein